MYTDSNFVGLFSLSLFFFTLYLKQLTGKKYYLSLTLLALVTFLTISRASIISLFIFCLLIVFRERVYKYRRLVFFISIIFMFFVPFTLLKFRALDESFSTKFTIFESTLEFLKTTSLTNILFGVGFGNAVNSLGIGAHNYLITYFVESGLIGLILILIFWGFMLYKSNFKVGIVMFPFLLNGMSLSTVAIPYLYVIFAVILVFESRRNQGAK
jgi:O-antigen ligase